MLRCALNSYYITCSGRSADEKVTSYDDMVDIMLFLRLDFGKPSERMQKIASSWRNLSDAERHLYNIRASNNPKVTPTTLDDNGLKSYQKGLRRKLKDLVSKHIVL